MNKLNTVLLVDDDEVINFVNQKVIHQMGIAEKIVTRSNGVEAISYIKDVLQSDVDQLPNLILLDTNMPMMDGYGFLEEFRTIKPKDRYIPIFMLTSLGYPDAIVKAHAYDIAGYLIKPLEKEIVEKVVLNQLSKKSHGK